MDEASDRRETREEPLQPDGPSRESHTSKVAILIMLTTLDRVDGEIIPL